MATVDSKSRGMVCVMRFPKMYPNPHTSTLTLFIDETLAREYEIADSQIGLQERAMENCMGGIPSLGEVEAIPAISRHRPRASFDRMLLPIL